MVYVTQHDQNGTAVPSWSCPQAVSKPVWHTPLLYVQRRTLDDGQRNCPKHVEFYSKNKFEKLAHLFGFIIRIYHDAWSPEGKKETLFYLVIRPLSIILNHFLHNSRGFHHFKRGFQLPFCNKHLIILTDCTHYQRRK